MRVTMKDKYGKLTRFSSVKEACQYMSLLNPDAGQFKTLDDLRQYDTEGYKFIRINK
jgi:hypothetical protein